jgi:hypothetical protein
MSELRSRRLGRSAEGRALMVVWRAGPGTRLGVFEIAAQIAGRQAWASTSPNSRSLLLSTL